MEKMLLWKGIGVVADNTPEEEGTFYAYSEDLLKKNVLLKFYSCELAEDEIETVVHALALYKGVAYTFYLYHHLDGLPPFPIQLFRIITDLVEYLTFCQANTLIDDLNALCSANISSDDKDMEPDYRLSYENEEDEFVRILGLIEQKRLNLS
ncbi:hypothetical protein [Chitinophaga defluvii]|uniref:Uncharacterized protein n=1 Tax=Chitinophaga defluvii TaxID=3163343 RepID=A0ABV2TCC7_9BACT